MKRRRLLLTLGAALVTAKKTLAAFATRKIRVSLRDAHKGTLEVDTQLLDSYGGPETNTRNFYLEVREHFTKSPLADFTDPQVLESAAKHKIDLMGGPLLGNLSSDGVSIWLRPATDAALTIAIGGRSFDAPAHSAGEAIRVAVDGLTPGKSYEYKVLSSERVIAQGKFKTPDVAANDSPTSFRLTFGSCFHKIGLHNPNLFNEILAREPHAMMLLGDIAVDDRNNEINMHRADYQLRDTSEPWSNFVSQVPVFASWDDHDYFDNDLSGIPKRYNSADRDAVRKVWNENWNNPPVEDSQKGIYFSKQVGPVEIIMLDTRSCRQGKKRGEYGSYLGKKQTEWLKETLKSSNAPFKVISSGTMWSDYVSKAKDTWGSWDTEAREEVFNLIEKEQIGGVLLVSGDRHGARGFKIPRPSGYEFYEFEPATLGGVSGPDGLVKNCQEQIFGYSGLDKNGEDFIAFGEFTFSTQGESSVTFRLITQHGKELETHTLTLDQLTPKLS